MNWTMIGALGELLGGIIVLASVIYLAVQVRHATAMARSEALRSFSQANTGWNLAVSTSNYAEVWAKALLEEKRRADLSPEERIRLATGYIAAFRNFELAYRSWQQRILTKEELEVIVPQQSALFRAPYLVDSWPVLRHELPDDFVAYMESLQPQLRANAEQ